MCDNLCGLALIAVFGGGFVAGVWRSYGAARSQPIIVLTGEELATLVIEELQELKEKGEPLEVMHQHIGYPTIRVKPYPLANTPLAWAVQVDRSWQVSLDHELWDTIARMVNDARRVKG